MLRLILSRRNVAAAAVGGIVGMGANTLLRPEPSIRFIGRKDTIFALLETGEERVLLLLGTYDEDLYRYLPGLKLFGSSRIDMVVATRRFLANQTAREYLQLDSTPAISLQADLSLPTIQGRVSSIATTTSFSVGAKTKIRIMSGKPGEGNEDHPPFYIEITYGEVLLLLMSESAMANHPPPFRANLLAIPGSPTPILATGHAPDCIVCTTPDEVLANQHQILVFPDDPTVISLHESSIKIRGDQLYS